MNYKETLNYLFEQLPMFHRIGAAAYKANLENTISISNVLGKPETSYHTLHIAGTNGKGSTSHFLASILKEAGYSCGLFTSPHLKDFRERIRVNGRMIPKSEVRNFVNEFKAAFDAIQPSFFEWTFGLATWHFRNQKVDIAVMETGMGGRLDSTNIITPDLAIITNIGWDHMQFLGNSLEKIATEKAGIIKPGIPVVVGETQEISDIFMKQAKSLQSPIFFADQELLLKGYQIRQKGKPILEASFEPIEEHSIIKIQSPLAGKYQLKNLATVLSAVKQLRKMGYAISTDHVKNGIRRVLRNTGFKGRWQVLRKSPLTIADIGHNYEGIREVIQQVELTPHRHLHFVLGVVNDKDVASMLRELPQGGTYYFCKAAIPRGMDATELKQQAKTLGLDGESYPSVRSALQAAWEKAGKNDLVLVGGSAFVVAEIV